MKNSQGSPRNALRALDRALGGQTPPTRIQRWVARRPVGAGLVMAVLFGLFFLLISPEGEPDSPLLAGLGGLAMGVVFGLVAFLERLRQRSLDIGQQQAVN